MPDLIGEIRKADKIIKRGAMPLHSLQCPWCGGNIAALNYALNENHTSKICNWKEKKCLEIIEDLAWNFDRGDCGQPDTPDPRRTLNEIIRIYREG